VVGNRKQKRRRYLVAAAQLDEIKEVLEGGGNVQTAIRKIRK